MGRYKGYNIVTAKDENNKKAPFVAIATNEDDPKDVRTTRAETEEKAIDLIECMINEIHSI